MAELGFELATPGSGLRCATACAIDFGESGLVQKKNQTKRFGGAFKRTVQKILVLEFRLKVMATCYTYKIWWNHYVFC